MEFERLRFTCVTGGDLIRQPRRQWDVSRQVEEHERRWERDGRHRFAIDLAQQATVAVGGRALNQKFRGYFSFHVRHFNGYLPSNEMFFHRCHLNMTSVDSPSRFEATHLLGRDPGEVGH